MLYDKRYENLYKTIQEVSSGEKETIEESLVFRAIDKIAQWGGVDPETMVKKALEGFDKTAPQAIADVKKDAPPETHDLIDKTFKEMRNALTKAKNLNDFQKISMSFMKSLKSEFKKQKIGRYAK